MSGGDDQLVIHDGQLIPKEKALALMLEEFTPFGYSAATVEVLLARAFFATQNFLSQLNWVSPEQRKSALDDALKKDAEVAARWRAQPREEVEAHAKRLEAAREIERKMREEADREQEERRKRYRQEQEEREEQKRKARLQDQFERWEEHNERINQWNEQAETRAAARKRHDDRMTYAVMAHIKEKEDRESWRRSRADRTLDLIGDHEYIQWMFECFCLPSRRWLAVL